MSSSEIEEIKNRLNIAELVGEYIRLAKAGGNWKALCPFHNEKTPSFMVSEERGSWHCFGCGKGGDIFSFVMEMEGIGFREALSQLAQKAGVELKSRSMNQESGIMKDEKSNLYKILELATKWYEKNLWEGRGKERILGYLRERGLNDASIKKFRLGYAPDGWRNILEFLTKRGFALDEISKTGLLVEKNPSSEIRNPTHIQNSGHYDRFRDRIMFPIQDTLGRVVGFSARVSPGGDEKSAKYVNTPQTVLYDKSRILYGLNFAKVEIKKKDEAILVEGNTDVIASHQAGFENTIAVSGTALTEHQVQMIKRYAENIKMGFDMDAAGQTAARRSIRICLENDLNVKIVQLESGKDAAESVREDPGEWKRAVERAKGVMEYYFEEILSRYDPGKPTDKKKIAHELLNVIKDISNAIEQAHWVEKLSEKIDTNSRILYEILRKARTGERSSATQKKDSSERITGGVEEKIIGLLLAFPKESRRALARITPEDFQDEKKRDIIKVIKQKEPDFNLEAIEALFSDYETKKMLSDAAFEAEVRFGGRDPDFQSDSDPEEELKNCIDRLKKENIKKKIENIARKIKAVEETGNSEETKLLIKEFQDLMEEMKRN